MGTALEKVETFQTQISKAKSKEIGKISQMFQ